MRKIILNITLFIFLLGMFMIVNIPANWIYQQFIKQRVSQYPIQIQIPQGTIWKGFTAIASNPDLPVSVYVSKIAWKWNYRKLMELQFLYNIEIESIEALGKKLGSYVIFVGVDLDGFILRAKDNDALLDLDLKTNFDNPRTIYGTVKPRKNDPEIQNLFQSVPQIKENGTFKIPF